MHGGAEMARRLVDRESGVEQRPTRGAGKRDLEARDNLKQSRAKRRLEAFVRFAALRK